MCANWTCQVKLPSREVVENVGILAEARGSSIWHEGARQHHRRTGMGLGKWAQGRQARTLGNGFQAEQGVQGFEAAFPAVELLHVQPSGGPELSTQGRCVKQRG